MSRVLCVDVGSTYTKAALVEVPSGRLLASSSHPTTIHTDVLEGVDAAQQTVESAAGATAEEVRACSSAGGGLRLAVVGYERAITAEAGARVGLSAGAKVVHVSAGPLDADGVRALRADRPDVVLLVGGTDGGNAEVLLHNAHRLASARLRAPIVVAGNADATDEVCAVLEATGRTALPTANVLPRIGVLHPTPARAAIREVFIRHVIGGKHLSRGPAFGRMVRCATPDAVLSGVELLADGAEDVEGAGDVVVVDVGGATTDVYSVVTPDPEEASLHREVVEVLWRERTVEGDLGIRWNATAVVAAAVSEQVVGTGTGTTPPDLEHLMAAAAVRVERPGFLPTDPRSRADDLELARLAATVALRRHARPADPVTPDGPRRAGKDLREVGLVVGSGGVFRAAAPEGAVLALQAAADDRAGGWKVPERAKVTVDGAYVLAAAGLLAPDHPGAAARLLAQMITRPALSAGS